MFFEIFSEYEKTHIGIDLAGIDEDRFIHQFSFRQ